MFKIGKKLSLQLQQQQKRTHIKKFSHYLHEHYSVFWKTFKTFSITVGCPESHICHACPGREVLETFPSAVLHPVVTSPARVVIGRLSFHPTAASGTVCSLHSILKQQLQMVVRFEFLYNHSNIGTIITQNVIQTSVCFVWQKCILNFKNWHINS